MAMTDATTRRYDSADSLNSFGLLVLRFATGATMVQAGLIKAFDLDSAVEFMDSTGWRMSKFAAILVTVAETAGEQWLQPHLFRFGASSLLNDVLLQRQKLKTGHYSGADYVTID